MTVIIFLLTLFILAGCGLKTSVEMGTEIISAKETVALIAENDVILVDARSSMDYKKGHLGTKTNDVNTKNSNTKQELNTLNVSVFELVLSWSATSQSRFSREVISFIYSSFFRCCQIIRPTRIQHYKIGIIDMIIVNGQDIL